MSSEANEGSKPTGEKASTDLADVISKQSVEMGRFLGKDDQGREHCYWPHTGRITVRAFDGLDTITVEEFDLDGKTLNDYRVFVDDFVDNCDVDWNEAAFR
jgi:hypothetical protein